MAVDQQAKPDVPFSIEAPFRSPVSALLERLHDTYSGLWDGEVATYIPELATVDPECFGIALATADGALYEFGDSRVPFTLQSISKPLTYALALERLGRSVVHARIGVEPSGDAFNSIDLAPGTGIPANAMINAGAIAAASLISSGDESGFAEVLAVFGRYAGRELEMDEAVYESERRTGHRNRAIAHLLRTFDVVDGNPEDGLDLYFRQCAISVDCRDLALIGATLANGGVQPLTGERVVGSDVVREVLSVMTSCGMYDGAGRWLTGIGLPAKSGVSGGILAVLPGRLAIAVFSPRLDPQGNSVRGVAVCRDLSSQLNLHLVRPGERVASPIRAALTLAQVSSKRRRSTSERRALDELGKRAVVYELQGELGFAAVELVARRVGEAVIPVEAAIVEIRRVTAVESGGAALLNELRTALEAAGVQLAVAGTPQLEIVNLLHSVERFDDLDAALEWCEDALLEGARVDARPVRIEVFEHELLRDFEPAELVRILPMLREHHYTAGDLVFARGATGDSLCLVTAGQLSVVDRGRPGRRLATVSAGMTFGELGFALGAPRSADVVADTDVELLVLDRLAFEQLREREPALFGVLLERLLASLARTTLRLDAEVHALAQ